MKKVGELTIAGFRYRLYCCDENEEKTGIEDGVGGMCHLSDQLIAINRTVSEEQQEDTVIHETLHALLYHSGAQEYLSKKLRLDKNSEAYEEVEETLLQLLSPHLRTLIPQLAKIKIPPRKVKLG